MKHRLARNTSAMIFVLATIGLSSACSSEAPLSDEIDDVESELNSCSFRVEKNEYDGAEWWGTIVLRNESPLRASRVRISLDVPDGVSCDYDPPGWTKTQEGNTCAFKRNKGVVMPGDTIRLNYSTNSQNFSEARRVYGKSRKCGAEGDGSSGARKPDDGADGADGAWRKANLTHFESYPAEGSEECREYNGCKWAGQFAGVNDKMSRGWVKAHNIVAVHSKAFSDYKLKTIRIREGNDEIDAVVYDMCSDKDCNGCCTKNAKETGFLLDIEKHTAQRFGHNSGVVEWKCLDCD